MVLKPVQTITEAEHLLFYELPKSPRQLFKGEAGLERCRELLRLLDNPQDAIPVIHIAGTNGKGSTATMIAALLEAAGHKVGLHVSPHVYDLRERMQINSQFISEAELCQQLNLMLPAIDQMMAGPHGAPTYFEATLALSLLVFRSRSVDYIVLETGLGGLYDSTNLVTRPDKVAVLTQIGLDHTHILGHTIGAIASQKAGIIKPGVHAIALWQSAAARNQFDKQVKASKGASLEYVKPAQTAQITATGVDHTTFNLKLGDWTWDQLELSLAGSHQVSNAVVPLRTVQYLGRRDGFELGEAAARQALAKIHLPARFEIRQLGSKTVVIDGAHNPGKMRKLAETLASSFPGQKFTFLVALTDTKNSAKSLKEILPLASHIYVTSFVVDNYDLLHYGVTPKKLGEQLERLGFAHYTVVGNAKEALAQALAASHDTLVVTGSFYLIASLAEALAEPSLAKVD